MTHRTKKPKTHPQRLGIHAWHIRVHFSLAAAVIGLWICLGILTGLFLLYAGKQVLHPARNTEPNYVEFDMQGISYDTKGSEPFLPGTGRQFLIVKVKVENYTSETFNLAPVIQSHITDEHGKRYDMSPDPVESPLVAGPVKAGQTQTGELTYSVPVAAQHLYFHFDADAPQAIHANYQIR